MELKNRESRYVLNVEVQCLIDIGGEGVSGSNRLLKKHFFSCQLNPFLNYSQEKGGGELHSLLEKVLYGC